MVERASERRGKTAVLVVGSKLMRDALGALLSEQPGLRVLDAAEPYGTPGDPPPDVAVVEIGPEEDGVSPFMLLARLRPAPRVVVLSNYAPRERIMSAIDGGADACVSIESGTPQLLAALDAARAGRRYIGSRIASLLMQPSAPLPCDTESSGHLTPREREVLALIAEGKTERQIGTRLGVSPKTVHVHRTNIMSKLGVRNVILLLRRALQLGLVEA